MATGVIGDVVQTAGAPAGTLWPTTFYLSDQTGSVIAEMSTGSASGQVLPRQMRDPFGNEIADRRYPQLAAPVSGANPDGSSNWGFAGHDRDNNWGAIDMGSRLYSPMLGRFLTPDTILPSIKDRRAFNPFTYAYNNPVVALDPDGHDPDGVVDAGTDAAASMTWMPGSQMRASPTRPWLTPELPPCRAKRARAMTLATDSSIPTPRTAIKPRPLTRSSA